MLHPSLAWQPQKGHGWPGILTTTMSAFLFPSVSASVFILSNVPTTFTLLPTLMAAQTHMCETNAITAQIRL